VKEGLLGRVRSVRTESSLWDSAAETWQAPQRVSLEEYREDGKMSVSEQSWNGQVSRSTYRYDEVGHLTETEFWNGEERAGSQVHEYNESGRLMRQVGCGHDGARVIEERSYAPDGSHVRVHQLPEGVIDFYCPVDGADYYFSAPGAREMITAYDSQCRVSEMRVRDAKGEVLRRFVLTRDGQGLLVRDELLLGDQPLDPDPPEFGPGTVLMANEYRYDERGRRIATLRRLFSSKAEREEYSYDDRGNRTEVAAEGTLGNGVARFTRFAYKYDAQGNWIERLASHRQEPNPDFTPSSLDRREIVYYP